MFIKDLHICGFGKFHDTDLSFDEKLNIISGKNEAGKSTLHAFIRAMLFGLDTRKKGTKPSEFESMRPWMGQGAYGGSMRIFHEGKNYLITRDFNRSPFDISVYCETTAEPVTETDRFIDEILAGLSQTAFLNTVSIGQLALATNKNMAQEIRHYIKNVETSANPDIDTEKAVAYLHNKRSEILEKIDTEAEKEYVRTLTEIRKAEEELSLPENNNRIRTVNEERTAVAESISRLMNEKQKNEEMIQAGESLLASKNLSSQEASIEQAEKEAGSVLDEYNRSKKKAENKKVYIAPVLFLLLFAAAGASALMTKGQSEFPVFAGLALICAVTAVILFAVITGNKKRYKKNKGLLTDIITLHTNETEISEDSTEKLADAFSRYKNLAGSIRNARSENAEKDQSIAGLCKKQDECINRLSEQQNIQLFVEQKMESVSQAKRRIAELKKILLKNDELSEEADAIELSIETLTGLSEAVKNSIGMIINEESGKILSGVTNGKYRSLDAGADFDIYLNSEDDMIPIYSLSAGTIDQVYLAVRIAAVRAMTDRTDRLPVLLDDSFALYDDERLRKAVMFMAENYQGQMFIFTCHNREEAALIEKNMTFSKIAIDKID